MLSLSRDVPPCQGSVVEVGQDLSPLHAKKRCRAVLKDAEPWGLPAEGLVEVYMPGSKMLL